MLNFSKEYWEDIKKAAGNIPDISGLYKKNVFITGATGMICSTVADMLWYLNDKEKAGIRLVLAGRKAERIKKRFPYMKDGDYVFMHFDTSDVSASDERFDFIIHGAGNADPKAIMEEPVETILTNIIGLHNLFGLLKDNDSRMLFISSSEIYGRNMGSGSQSEEDYGFVDILNPRSSYPNAKRISETLCAAYKEEYGKDSVIVRPGHVYGPSVTDRDSRASAEFTRRVAGGKDIVLKSDGRKVRSYVYTADCASAIITVLLKGESTNAYNISNPDTSVSIKKFAEVMADAGGVDVVFDTETVQDKRSGNMMDNSAIDPGRLCSIGWKPEFDLESGIRATLRDYIKEQ